MQELKHVRLKKAQERLQEQAKCERKAAVTKSESKGAELAQLPAQPEGSSSSSSKSGMSRGLPPLEHGTETSKENEEDVTN